MGAKESTISHVTHKDNFLKGIEFEINKFDTNKNKCNDLHEMEPYVFNIMDYCDDSHGHDHTVFNSHQNDSSKHEAGVVFNQTQINPFVASLLYAFTTHSNVHINPSHIQYILINSLGTYINQASRKFREVLGIKHIGKMTITIDNDKLKKNNGSLKTPKMDAIWEEVFPAIVEQIKQNTSTIVNNMCTKLSCATTSDIMANHVAIMCTLKSYFEYRVRTRCGIGKISLGGTKDDWVALYNMFPDDFQDKFLNAWIKYVKRILQYFIDSFDNKIDLKFFNSMVKYESMSGGYKINGWFLVFFYPAMMKNKEIADKIEDIFCVSGYNNDITDINMLNKLSIENISDIPNGISCADILWTYFTKNYDLTLYGGLYNYVYNPNTNYYSVETGWELRIK